MTTSLMLRPRGIHSFQDAGAFRERFMIFRVRLVAAATTIALIGGANLAAGAATETLFGSSVPSAKIDVDSSSVTLGTTLTVKKSGKVTGIRFFKGAANTGIHLGGLFSSSGTLLSRVTFTNETSSGWQSANLPVAQSFALGTKFTVALFAPQGHYVAMNEYTWPKDTLSLSGTSGVYRYGSTLAYPSSRYQSSNYFIDVAFSPSASPTPNPTNPTVSPTPVPTAPVTPTPTAIPTTVAPTPSATSTLPNTYPNAANTGPVTELSLPRIPEDIRSGTGWHYDTRGWVQVDGDGAVFNGYSTALNVDVTADNVTISNNIIALTDAGWGISLRHTSGVKIKNNIIKGQSFTNPCDNAIRGIYGDDDTVTIEKNELYNCWSGINHLNRGGLIQDNYIHDLGSDSGNGAHLNGIQLGSGSGPLMTITHNTILNQKNQTDCIMLANDDGAQTNRIITNNLLGGGGYSFYGSGGPSGVATNVVFRGNKFTTRFFPNGGYWGPVAHWKAGGSGNVWADNTWFDGPRAGQPVN